MKMKDQAIKNLEELEPGDLVRVCDLISSLKGKRPEEKRRKPLLSYTKVRRALKQCKGSLSEDILAAREDRI